MHNAVFNISFDAQTVEEFHAVWALVHGSPSPANVTVNPPRVESKESPSVQSFDPESFDYSAPFESYEHAYLAATDAKRFPRGSNPPPVGEREARERFAEGLCAKIGLDLSRLQIEKEEEPETELEPEAEPIERDIYAL